MDFRKYQLDNGLEIIAECNPKAYSMAMGFFVNTGARDETEPISGVSHFLEHMVFKGTPQRTAEDVNRELDEIGSQSNAFTSEEHTVYYAAVLPDYQDRVLDLLADIMRPSLRQDDFDTEKKVIIEEIRKYDDQPPYGAHERSMAKFFGAHPLGNSILGTVESIHALKRDAMMAYFEKRYSPGNITLVATGNVDFDKLVHHTHQRCGEWPALSTERQFPKFAEMSVAPDFIPRPSAAQQYVVQLVPAPSAGNDRRHAHRLMSMILGDETGSRLFWELVDTGRAEYAVTGTYEFQDAGIVLSYMACDPEDTADNLKIMAQLKDEVEEEGVTESELELARSKLCSQVVRRAERPSNRLFAVGGSWLQRRVYRTVRDVVDSYQAVTLEGIQASLSEYSLTKNATAFAGPLKELEIK